jgi:hypothetical protein
MVDCVEVCVWEPEDGFPEDGEGSLKALLGEPDCMIRGWLAWIGEKRKEVCSRCGNDSAQADGGKRIG